MTATNHALTGAMIGVVVQQPYLAIPLAFLSHFLCDALPHFESGFTFGKKSMYVYLFFDGLFALLAAAFLLWQGVENPIFLAICGFVAMSPDLIWLYYGLKNQFGNYSKYGPVTRLHHRIQWSATKLGIIPEAVWAVVVLGVIIKIS